MTNEKMEQIALAILAGKSTAVIAAENRVSDRTLRRLKNTAHFQEMLSTLRTAAVERALDELYTAVPEAMQNLRRIAGDPKASPSARVAASKAILALGVQYFEAQAILPRLEALEENQQGRSDYGKLD